MSSMKQASFTAGELAPGLHARSDLAKSHQGLKTCKNFIVRPQGGIYNRAGTKLVKEVKDSDDFTRLLPFVFNSEQSYVLEFGDGYIRFHQDGGTITGPSGVHDGGAAAAALTDSGENWIVDQWVDAIITNLTNGKTATVTANTANTITGALSDGETWDVGDTYSLDAAYEIASPYGPDDLARLHVAPMNDVLTIVHPNYYPRELKRWANDKWSIDLVNIVKPVKPPTEAGTFHKNSWDSNAAIWAVTAGVTWDDVHPAQTWAWAITSVDAEGNESLPLITAEDTACTLYNDCTKPEFEIVAPATGNAPVKYNWYRGNHGVYGYVGSSDDLEFIDEGHAPDYSDSPPEETDPFTRTVQGSDDVQREATFSGTDANKDFTPEAPEDMYTFHYSLTLGPYSSVTLEFWRDDDGVGFDTQGTRYHENTGKTEIEFDAFKAFEIDGMGLDSDFRITIQSEDGIVDLTRNSVTWTEAGTADDEQVANYPSTVCYFEQRRAFGAFTGNGQQIVTSKTGWINTFDVSFPSQPNDSVDLTLASIRLDEIRAMVPLEVLMVFTAGAEWMVSGVQGGPLTPSSFDLKPRTYHGSSWVSPIAVGEAVLFVTNAGTELIELSHDRYYGKYSTNDLTILANHLFEGFTISETAFTQSPSKVVWIVRSDGTLLGCTYARQHEVWAWHQHETEGTVESICSVPEAGEDALYMIVNRENGRYIERMSSRLFTDIDDAVFLDSAIAFNGANTGTTSIKAHNPTDSYAIGSAVTLEATTGTPFASGDVGDFIDLTDGTDTARFRIYEYTDSDTVLAEVMTTVVAGLQDTTKTTWSWLRDTFSGLSHLEGMTVVGVLDGAVSSEVVVASGAVTFDHHGERVLIGLPYESLAESLDFQGTPEGILDDKRKTVSSVHLRVVSSRGIWAAAGDGAYMESKLRSVSDGYGVPNLFTGTVEISLPVGWYMDCGVKVKQVDPLPLEVIAAIPNVETERS